MFYSCVLKCHNKDGLYVSSTLQITLFFWSLLIKCYLPRGISLFPCPIVLCTASSKRAFHYPVYPLIKIWLPKAISTKRVSYFIVGREIMHSLISSQYLLKLPLFSIPAFSLVSFLPLSLTLRIFFYYEGHF